MNQLISVVVPIFNVEQWIPGCIEGILKQPYKNIELILVNDSSTDKSGEICEQYAKKDKRIKVLHKENGGVSSARNKGIENATGRYIVFIDPDDEIDQGYFIKFLNIAESNNCDVVMSGYKTIPNNVEITPGFKLDIVMSGKQFILSSKNIHSRNDLAFSWRYFYKSSIIKNNNVKFNEAVSIGEDVIFNLEILLTCSRVYAISEPLYFYTVNNPNSAMRKPFKPNLEKSLIEQYKVRKELSQKYGLLEYDYYQKDMANYYINNIYRLMIANLEQSKNDDLSYALSRILNYEMISESLKVIGLSYKCNSIKEYLYYIALKYNLIPVLFKFHKKSFQK